MENMTRNLLSGAVLALSLAAAAPAFAADAGDRDFASAQQTVPDILSSKQKQLYTQVLGAIRGQRWTDAKALLDDSDNGPHTEFLRAELLTKSEEHTSELQSLMRI